MNKKQILEDLIQCSRSYWTWIRELSALGIMFEVVDNGMQSTDIKIKDVNDIILDIAGVPAGDRDWWSAYLLGVIAEDEGFTVDGLLDEASRPFEDKRTICGIPGQQKLGSVFTTLKNIEPN